MQNYSDRTRTLIEAAQSILKSEVDAVMWVSCLHENFRRGKQSPKQAADRDESGLQEAFAFLRSQRSLLLLHGWTGKPAVHWKNAPNR